MPGKKTFTLFGAIILLIIALLLFKSSVITASDFDFGWDEPVLFESGYYEQLIDEQESDSTVLLKLIYYYRNYERDWRGTACPCFPTCSAFMSYSIIKYGTIVGLIIGMDRLYFRENRTLLKRDNFYHPIERSDFLEHYQRSGAYDPPEANNIFIGSDWRSVLPYFYFIRERDRMPEYQPERF